MNLRLHAVFACLPALPAILFAGDKAEPLPPLVVQTNATKTVRFRTPEGWSTEHRAGVPEFAETRGDGLIVRILRWPQEVGLDSLHSDCMLVRLADEAHSEPKVDYEYDFVGGSIGERRALDSAFVVRYDEPIDGARDWRQRNVTVVGQGDSVCIVGYGPMPAVKKSRPKRRLLDAVLSSVELQPWR